jgi:chemotaxis protein MotB
MAGAGGGAWKVAYADFVTAMMAFFMVMWLIASSKPAVKEAVSEYFKDPMNYMKTTKAKGKGVPLPAPQGINLPYAKGSGSQMKPTKYATAGEKSSNVKGQKNIEPGKVSLKVAHDGKKEHIGTIVQFDPMSSTLNEAAKEELNILAPALRGKRHKIEVRAHAVRRPVEKRGAEDEDWILTYNRCMNTMQFLISQGVEAERFRLSQASSFEPLTISGNAVDLEKNARVEVYLLDEITEDLVGTKEERAKRFQTPDHSANEK